MVEYTTINVTLETKAEFDRQRSKIPQGEPSQDDFLAYLLRENAKRK